MRNWKSLIGGEETSPVTTLPYEVVTNHGENLSATIPCLQGWLSLPGLSWLVIDKLKRIIALFFFVYFYFIILLFNYNVIYIFNIKLMKKKLKVYSHENVEEQIYSKKGLDKNDKRIKDWWPKTNFSSTFSDG